ncbi:MAG TPA: hypothetical protein VII71_00040, partial [Verrucomicrobiae bacterium]
MQRLIKIGRPVLFLRKFHHARCGVLPHMRVDEISGYCVVYDCCLKIRLFAQRRRNQQDNMKQNRTGLSKISLKKKHCAARKIKGKEEALAKNGKCHDKCLEESLELQKCLRQLTHRMLAAQEDERAKLSHELQDEIAQTLLGINVRLLSLKQ